MIRENLIDLDSKQLKVLKKTLKSCIPGKTVWAYGSRVEWKAQENSDLDLVVFGCDDREISNLKEILEESNLLISVDVLDWESIPEDFKINIQKKYVVVQESSAFSSDKSTGTFPPDKGGQGGWQKVKLEEVADIIGGFAFKSKHFTILGDEYVVRIKDIKPPFIDIQNAMKAYISDYSEKKLEKFKIQKGDFVVAMTGATIGKVGRFTEMNRAYINQRVAKINPHSNINKKFIYYNIINKPFYSFIKNNIDSNSAQENISATSIGRYPFYLPPLPEQRVIAEVLSSLDDKIELLHQQNKTLEGLAQTLFHKWFIKSAKPHWKNTLLGDLLKTIESGSRPKGGIDSSLKEGVPSIGAESINGIGNFDFSKTKYVTKDFFSTMKKGVVKDYDILIYKDGAYIGKKAMFGKGFPFKEMAVNEHVFILRANSLAYQFFIYFFIKQEKLTKLNANSAQPGLNQQAMKSLEITIPPKEKVNDFADIVKPWIDKILFNSLQIKQLENLRNTLLPKLITGQVKVAIDN